MTKQIKKYIWRSVGVLLLAFVVILGFNSYTVVQDGTVKVGKFMGKVDPVAYTPGFNAPVNPLMSFDTYSTKDIRLQMKGLQVPSQDKLKSNIDITVMLQFDGKKAPLLKINGGTEEEALDKYVRQKLISTILEFGKEVTNAQDLFTATTQRGLQDSIRDSIRTYASPYGYEIKEIMIQDITLPPVVQEQVVNTKLRQEQIQQAIAETKREKELAQKQVATAEANREAAEQQALATERSSKATAFATKQAAEARAYATKQDAEAKLFAAQKEAEANSALQRTITPEMVKWRQLDVEQLRASKYKGDVPTTVVGAGYDGQMIMDMRNSTSK